MPGSVARSGLGSDFFSGGMGTSTKRRRTALRLSTAQYSSRASAASELCPALTRSSTLARSVPRPSTSQSTQEGGESSLGTATPALSSTRRSTSRQRLATMKRSPSRPGAKRSPPSAASSVALTHSSRSRTLCASTLPVMPPGPASRGSTSARRQRSPSVPQCGALSSSATIKFTWQWPPLPPPPPPAAAAPMPSAPRATSVANGLPPEGRRAVSSRVTRKATTSARPASPRHQAAKNLKMAPRSRGSAASAQPLSVSKWFHHSVAEAATHARFTSTAGFWGASSWARP